MSSCVFHKIVVMRYNCIYKIHLGVERQTWKYSAMAQEDNHIMNIESRINQVETEQDYLRDSLNKLISSQEKQTSEMRENTTAMMIMCHKLDSSTEIGKKALDRVDGIAMRVNTLETRDDERHRTEKTHFIGMMIISGASIAAILKAFGVL